MFNIGLSEEQVVDLCKSAGQVLNFRIVYDKDTGRPKGFGFAEFASADEAASAVRNLNGHEIMNRTLRVDYSNEAGGGDASSKHEQQTHQQAQHWQQQQQQMQQQQNQPSQPQAPPQVPTQQLPQVGVTLPDNVSAPDAISRTLAAMDPNDLLSAVSSLKNLSTANPQEAKNVLTQYPQLCYAVFQSLLLMGLVDPGVLGQLLETSQRTQPQQPAQPQQTPFQYQPPAQQYPQQPPQYPQQPPAQYPHQPPPHQPPPFPPQYGQQPMMGTPVHNQGYPPPPNPQQPQKPPHIPDEQWQSIRTICNFSQHEIDMQNPREREGLMAIRHQYLPYFSQPQPYRSIPGY